ncbi:MAG: hypothetical protein US86_C0001G0039 [Candidatus Daviesbacteria bacterium GW2011_GWA2_38_24]|uniref:Uncharacterized protein n=1 Tax=Candidatus Daviesbacteria bacterium GW2011_GWA2_38_24 TaxID=1618422 RepID=A0A0G0JJX6_9BACT|nr:MAG: hypothetical protein US86_C0001G0039 [Candidatus Daviesbacteria bacterium GW2011_GWA2_38_24]OGE22788.1 MAG: hypothetical protein A2688_00850 [Candidatus Daviesbacteria bacterium RIFCSPHIGHO2_01_FULL_38_8]
MKSSFIVDEKRITEIKWRTPFRALYQPKDGSGLPPYGAGDASYSELSPDNIRIHFIKLREVFTDNEL